MRTFKTIAAAILSLLAVEALAQSPKYPTIEEKDKEKKKWDEPARQHVFKFNLLSPVYETIMLFYQHNLSADKSFQLGLGYMNFNGFDAFMESDKNTNAVNPRDIKYNYSERTEAFFVMPEYRIQISGADMRGFFVSPFVKYTNMKYHETYDTDTGFLTTSAYYPYSNYRQSTAPKQTVEKDYTYQSLGFGAVVGQQVIIRNKISFEYYAGPVYNMLLSSSGTGLNTSRGEVIISDFMNPLMLRGYGIRAGVTIGFLF